MIEAADRQRGGRPLSGYLADLVQADGARRDAVAQPKAEIGPIPALLKECWVQHALGVRQDTREIIMNASAVHPVAETAKRLEQPKVPFSIKHYDELLPASAQVSQGRHRIAPQKCDGCALVVNDAPDWC